MDVHCLLFTDMLLICKSLAKKGDRVKVIRPPYIIDRIEIHEMKDCSGVLLIYLNEYNVVTSVYTLISNDIKIWLDAIRKAQVRPTISVAWSLSRQKRTHNSKHVLFKMDVGALQRDQVISSGGYIFRSRWRRLWIYDKRCISHKVS